MQTKKVLVKGNVELLVEKNILEEEVKRYKTLWKRECEAYKDLAIKTGNWDVEEA